MSIPAQDHLQVKTLEGGDLHLNGEMIASLRARVRGPVILPDDPSYEIARTIWNAMIDRRPSLIIRCTGTADVLETVRFARERDLLTSVRAGGHNIAGLAVADGGLMIDLTAMKGVFVDPKAKRVIIQPGCTLGNVDRETQVHGLATPLGFVSLTGAAGLTLGGGFGYLTRRFGWASDNLLSAEVVTADGRLVRASEEENPDLFWGLRGGGGNFGVVTSLEYRLHEVGPRIVGGMIFHPMEEAADFLRFYAEYTAKAPRELASQFVYRFAPPAPFIPKEWHGKPVVGIILCHSGGLEEANRDLEPLKAWGKPVADAVGERTYCEQQGMMDATQPTKRRYYWKSDWISGITNELGETLIGYAKRFPSPFSAIGLFHVSGAIGELPEDATAMDNRDSVYNLNITTGWDDGPSEPRIAWARECWRAVRSYSTGGVYVNFLTDDEGRDRLPEAYRQNLGRLRSLKSKWDPANFFRMNHNVKPDA